MQNHKIVVIPDLHGKTVWRQLPDRYPPGEYTYVFLGDYVDSFTHTDMEIVSNLESLLLFKATYPSDVILLLGNHDVQYKHAMYRCSGYRDHLATTLYDLYNHNPDYTQAAHCRGRLLFTHAGVTTTFLAGFDAAAKRELPKDIRYGGIAEKLNWAEHHSNPLRKVMYYFGDQLAIDSAASQKRAGITWVRPPYSEVNALTNFHQIVGHTRISRITTSTIGIERSITYCDCLDYTNEFLIIPVDENGQGVSNYQSVVL